MRKADVAYLRAGELEPNVREALEIRAELSKSSTKKYYALHGATGSWAGRLFQPQNLPRGTIKPDHIGIARAAVKLGDYDLLAMLYSSVSDVLVYCVRTAIAAPPGKALIVADYASIETVMIPICEEPGRLNRQSFLYKI